MLPAMTGMIDTTRAYDVLVVGGVNAFVLRTGETSRIQRGVARVFYAFAKRPLVLGGLRGLVGKDVGARRSFQHQCRG